MQNTIKLNYGSIQPLLSGRMHAYPLLSKWVNRVLGYTNIGNYARSKVFTRQIQQLPLQSFERILDLGCGYGEYAFMMSRSFPEKEITAVDIDPDALQKVRYAKAHLQQENLRIHGDYLSTLRESEFDFIYSVDVFEHIEEQDMPFKEAKKKLKKGGYLMVKMPHKTQSSVLPKRWFKAHEEWLNHEHPGQIYTLDQLQERFEREGFNIIFTAQTDGILSRLAWELAYLMKKAGIITQLISLPFCKALIRLDLFMSGQKTSRGNAITVIGQKTDN